MSYSELIQNYINVSYTYPPNLADQCKPCQKVLLPNPCDPCWKNPFLPPPQPSDVCGPQTVGTLFPSATVCPYTTPPPGINSYPCGVPPPVIVKTKKKRKCKCKSKKKCGCKSKNECGCKSKSKGDKLVVGDKDMCGTPVNISTGPAPCRPCAPCDAPPIVCPPQPCNECEKPWIKGWPWITRTWQ